MKRPDFLPTMVALIGSFALGGLLLAALGVNPLQAYEAMLAGSLGSLKGLAQTLSKSIPLVLVGLGIIVAFQARIFNIGAEGQMIVGALAGTALGLALPALPGPVLLPMVLAAGVTAGALWAGLAGYLKARFGVNEILSTVMLNQVALQLMNFLLSGPMLDPAEIAAGTRIPQSAALPAQIWLPRLIPRTTLHAGLLFLPLLAGAVYFLLRRTTLGFELRAVGLSPLAARYAGIGVGTRLVLAMLVSGALAGLAGIVEVTGLHHRSLEGMTGGAGFAGIVAALLGRLDPRWLLPAGALFAALLVGADKMQRTMQVPASLAIALQGLILCLLVSAEAWERRRRNRRV